MKISPPLFRWSTCAYSVFLCAAAAAATAPLPEGAAGLAARYPGDAGIQNDPDVIFVEDFEEASMAAMHARWEQVQYGSAMTFAPDVPAGSPGRQSLLISALGGTRWGGDLYRRIPDQDVLFLRCYLKFDSQCYGFHHGPLWAGGHRPSTSYPWPRAGIKPVGDERFSTAAEPFGSAWRWDFYTYWKDMRGNPGDSNFWGNDFVNDTGWPAVRGGWICVELMVKLNQPASASNGEQALWINGQLRRQNGQVISHLGESFPKGNWVWDSFHPDPGGTPFQGFQWRTVDTLKINYLWPQVYIDNSPNGYESKVWFDHLVAAKKYIGPLGQSKKSDFNGDRNADILLRHPSNGQVVLWLMNGMDLPQ